MGYAANIIERYKKICALADQGKDGEADNAKRLKEKMQKKHPGIHKEAYPPKGSSFFDFKGFDDSDLFQREPKKRDSAAWETFTEKAGDFFSKVKDFTFNAMGIQRAKEVAKDCTFTSRENNVSVSVTCRLPDDILDLVFTMTEEEKFAFLEELAQDFADKVSEFIYEDPDED